MSKTKINAFTSIIIALLFNGCLHQQPNEPSLKNLIDVSYVPSKSKELTLVETIETKNHHENKELKTANINSQPYERVPNFDVKHKKNTKYNTNKNDKIVINGKKVKLSVEAIPTNEFIDLLFSNILKLNYTVAQNVRKIKKPITLNMTNSQSKQEVFEVAKKLLSLNGIDIRKENGMFFLSKSSNSVQGQLSNNIYIGYGRSIKKDIPDNEIILMFIPYEFIRPKSSVFILKSAGINTKFYYPSSNVQMMKGTAEQVRKALNVINRIDRPHMKDKNSYILELKNIDVKDFKTRIQHILLSNGIDVVDSPKKDGLVISLLPELNSLFIVTPKKAWLDMLIYWKNKLDIHSPVDSKPNFYTYKVKNRKADELAEALNSVVDIKLASINKQETKKDTIPKEKPQSNPTIKFDLPTNTLMMQMHANEYKEILPLIEELDALPLQVLVEVTLAEVTLTDTFNLGFEYALVNNAALGSNPVSNTLITSAFGGSGFSAIYDSKNLDITMNAYAEDKLLSIMSNPKILILNNETGSINVGTRVPIITSESSATDIGGGIANPSILRNISYQNTGIVVGLMPTINSNGILTMNVNLQLSEAQLNDTSDISSPLLVNRSLSTSLTIQHGQTVLLGGLISKNKSKTDNGVPYLANIPLIGNLFKAESEKVVKTELIMLIKPLIIQSPKEMTEETKKHNSILNLLNEYTLY